MNEQINQYASVLNNILRIQNRLVDFHTQRRDIYNELFFHKRMMRASTMWKTLRGKTDEESLKQELYRINQRELGVLKVILNNNPRKMEFIEDNIPQTIKDNLLSYYDELNNIHREFLTTEAYWIANQASTQELFKLYYKLIARTREYQARNTQVIRSHGKYLAQLKALLDQIDHDPGRLRGYAVYLLPFVALFDPFMDAYYKLVHDVDLTPIPNWDNLAILATAIILVYCDGPTKLGSLYANLYDTVETYIKKNGWSF